MQLTLAVLKQWQLQHSLVAHDVELIFTQHDVQTTQTGATGSYPLITPMECATHWLSLYLIAFHVLPRVQLGL